MTEQRLNGETERRLDSMALVIMLLNDHEVQVPDEVNESIDALGVRLLGHFKNVKQWSTEQTEAALTAFAESMVKASQH